MNTTSTTAGTTMTAATSDRSRHRRGWALIATALALLLAGLGWMLQAAHLGWMSSEGGVPPAAHAVPLNDPALIARGAYLARVGNCAGCHTARGGASFAGGRGLLTPFGTVYASNLTPDRATGLGEWRADDFWRALHLGRSRDGRLLSPAFPYTEMTQIRREDSDALWAYLHSLPPVPQANTPHTVRWPYNTQAALVVWRALYFQPAEFQPDPKRSAEWNRGAYLVRGPGHCAACHAPRNELGAVTDPLALAGGAMPLQPWFAPALAQPAGAPPDQVASAALLIAMLKTGVSDHGAVMGPMAEVVLRSTQYWTDADLQATATYLQDLPHTAQRPTTAPGPAPSAASGAITSARATEGARLYEKHCADCHGAQGQGAPGAYPPLVGNPSITQANPTNLIQAVLHGGFAPATAGNPRPYGMPPFELPEADIAAILTHIRSSWGQQAPAVTTLDVLRQSQGRTD